MASASNALPSGFKPPGADGVRDALARGTPGRRNASSLTAIRKTAAKSGGQMAGM
jgi:hypothetical protein